jgi:hypothetical protein
VRSKSGRFAYVRGSSRIVLWKPDSEPFEGS